MTLHPDYAAALRSLRLTGDTARLGAASRSAAPGTTLADAARELLYSAFYLRGRRRPPPVSAAAQSAFVQSLVAAARSPHGYEAGWEPLYEERGLLVLSRRGLRLWAAKSALLPGGLLRVPPVQRGMLPGTLIALGSTPPRSDTDDHTLRLYWNLRAKAAARWIGAVTGALEANTLPFRLKLPDSPAGYWRADAGVVYVDRRDADAALAALAPVHVALPGAFYSATPRFTKRLAPGLARADDPPGDDSFGESRCRLVAEACLAGPRLRDRIAALHALLSARGLDPERPWIQP